jgi:hypothetical protein
MMQRQLSGSEWDSSAWQKLVAVRTENEGGRFASLRRVNGSTLFLELELSTFIIYWPGSSSALGMVDFDLFLKYGFAFWSKTRLRDSLCRHLKEGMVLLTKQFMPGCPFSLQKR